MAKRSFVLTVSFLVLYILEANGQSRMNSIATNNSRPWNCIREKICQCGQGNQFKKCTDLVEDASVRLLIDSTSSCSGVEDKDTFWQEGSWICGNPSSFERRCGEQVTSSFLNPAVISAAKDDIADELTVEERVRELDSLRFFPCFLDFIASCKLNQPQC
ncbi:uncharacterized protein LOC129225579 [Uloborus diversus]|uniref:uncharacterized protein LOC129225579 n=1 Tax=Uloborus diversus TaxID=327109 RepID=UPI00240A2B69|nr:uncharacterized protein LOC129225579 [Uloborus diversus]